MDIKNSPARYAETCGGTDVLTEVGESVRLLMNGDTPYEFRTTVGKDLHTAREMRGIGEWLCGAKRYFLQSFEDSGRILGKGIPPSSPGELYTYRQIQLPCIPDTYICGV